MHGRHVQSRVRPAVQAHGFTLVETLIALLVLAIGLLGVAALHVQMLQFARSAQHRRQAVSIAADLAERIRANRSPANAYAGNGAGARAIADLAEWHALVAAQLPQGEGAVRYVAGTPVTPVTYNVRVTWTEIGQAEPASFELRLEI
jgi:type IV pilus assembly protein PilV